MGASKKDSALTAYLRLLGNPYAKLQILGEEHDGDLVLRGPSEAEREYARRQANQYTLLSVAIAQAGVPLIAPPSAVARQAGTEKTTLSKKDFVAECTRVFRPYIPAIEKGRLRRHHRDFITRNQNRSPAVRYALAHEVRKYDLSSLAGISAQFNRERDPLTDQKLKQIERLVIGHGK